MPDLAERLRKLLLAPAMAFAIPDDSVREHIQEKVRDLADEVEAAEEELIRTREDLAMLAWPIYKLADTLPTKSDTGEDDD